MGAPIHTITEHLAGGHHIILTYKTSTCKYLRASQTGSSRSICAVTALNCIRLAFQLEAGEGVEETILQSFFSEEMMNQIMGIANDPFFDNHLEIDDILEVPIFKETIIAAGKEQGHPLEIFKDLLLRLFPPDSLKPILAVVFTQTPEHFVCFRFRSSASYIFVIFDAHSRSEHPFGPAFILANDVDAIATHFNRILTTQPSSISKSDFKQDVTTNHSFTTLVIESSDRPSLAQSVAILTEKLNNVDRTPSNLELDSPDFGLELGRVRETQSLLHAPPHEQQDNNRRTTSHHSKPLTRRSEFGWQLNLQVSSTSTSSSIVDPKNEPLENKRTRSTLDLPKRGDSDLLILDPEPDVGEDIVSSTYSIPDNSHSHLRNNHHRTEFGWQSALQQTSITDSHKPVADNTHSHWRNNHHRIEFGWQLALQQTSIADRHKPKNTEVVASTEMSEADTQTHRVAVGKERVEFSDEFFETQTLGGSLFGWEDIPLFDGYLSQKGAWIPSNAAASSSYIQNSNRGFTTLDSELLPTNEFPDETHECGVCSDLFGVAQSIQLPTCKHSFCRECLRTFTKVKIDEGRYPILCPVCAIERSKVINSHITQEIVDELELSWRDLKKLYALQLVEHSVVWHCPKCKQTMNVDREEYASQRIITCPLPTCRHPWCKECLKSLASGDTEHNCKQQEFDLLMQKKGWKYCPGCKTPVQKETGCNHMTCGSPGCNVHFCYKCGSSIINTSNGGDVGRAVKKHYNNCVMFDE